MDSVLTSLVEQIPAALLIAAFVIYWTRDQQKSQSQRDAAVQAAMDKRDELMRQFWASQQESNRDVLERLAQGVEAVTAKLDIHDRKADRALELLERPRTRRSTQS